MRTVITLTASVIAVLALTPMAAEARQPAGHTSCKRPKLLAAYSTNYYAVRKLHGKRAPGRNIRRDGLGRGRPAKCFHIRKSLRTLRRMRHPGNRLLSPRRPYTPPAGTATLRTTSAPLSSIRACESGGSYTATSPGGTYRGAYQFDQRTWNSVGGSGDPAAASPAEQDKRAAILYTRRGSAPWPVCGR
jgi:hypothetical protein